MLRRTLLTLGLLVGGLAPLGADPAPQTWAIVVGIDQYFRPGVSKLRYAVADAKLFAQALKDTLKVPADHLFLMTSDTVDENSEPRFVNISYRLSWLRGKVKKNDTLIFYFAGHGATVAGEPFLLTEEADLRSDLTLRATSLQGGDLMSTLRKLESGHCWVMFDACRNSPGESSVERLDARSSAALSQADVGLNETATMLSCKVGQRSWEWDEKKHGCYTYFLVEGLRQRAADTAGRVTLQGLADFVSAEVPPVVRKLGAEQNPTMFYGGANPAQWLLAQVAPPQGSATAQVREADTSIWVARLEALQARLDQETARRVQAEEKARLAESQRQVAEKQLAVLEQRVLGKSGPVAPEAQVNPVAYLDRGAGSEVEAELARLRRENEELKKRLDQFAAQSSKLGMSREVLLESQPLLARRWEIAQKQEREAAAEANLAGSLRQREALVSQISVLATAFPSKGRESERLHLNLESQQLLSELYEARHEAAVRALGEAGERLQEANTREQKHLLLLAQLQAQLQSNQAELASLRSQLADTERKLQETERKLSQSQDELGQALQKLKEIEDRKARQKDKAFTRSFEDRQYQQQPDHLAELNWKAHPDEAQGELPGASWETTRPGQGPGAQAGQSMMVRFLLRSLQGEVLEQGQCEVRVGKERAEWQGGLRGIRQGEVRRHQTTQGCWELEVLQFR